MSRSIILSIEGCRPLAKWTITLSERCITMTHAAEEQESAERCNGLLEQANEIYLEIEKYYQAMQHDLSATSIPQIMQKIGVLNTMLQEAQAIDKRVADALEKTSGVSGSTRILLEKRGEILSRIYQGNRNIVARARNVQSLLRHEISSLASNKKAITGYKAPDTDRKQMLCASC